MIKDPLAGLFISSLRKPAATPTLFCGNQVPGSGMRICRGQARLELERAARAIQSCPAFAAWLGHPSGHSVSRAQIITSRLSSIYAICDDKAKEQSRSAMCLRRPRLSRSTISRQFNVLPG